RGERLALPQDDRDRVPRVDRGRLQVHAVRGFEEAHRVLGALQVAPHPVQVLGGGAEHQRAPRIQVFLVPPPWLEFTTSEPGLSATRVSPPGMTTVSRPLST